MDTFVKRFQPERYQAWLEGNDYGQHPEDPSNSYAPAPPPSHLDVICNKKYELFVFCFTSLRIIFLSQKVDLKKLFLSASAILISYEGVVDTIPMHVMQRMKKQCNPTKAKSFKERNPDLDLDEIQENPNIPDDIKAVLKESLLILDTEDDDLVVAAIDNNDTKPNNTADDSANLLPAHFNSRKELLAYIDDGTGKASSPPSLSLFSLSLFV